MIGIAPAMATISVSVAVDDSGTAVIPSSHSPSSTRTPLFPPADLPLALVCEQSIIPAMNLGYERMPTWRVLTETDTENCLPPTRFFEMKPGRAFWLTLAVNRNNQE